MCEDFAEIDLNVVESIFRSNILAMFAITKYAIPHMKKGSSIINTTSTVAFRGTASMVDYSSTKGAIVSFTRSLAKNLMPKGIRVNAVAPGPVHTPLQPASRPAEQMKGFGAESQIGRPGQPSEIAPSFVFLASKDSELYYGQILHAYPLGD
jgi:NAD(P)-dependent dehydrogenase (short-subunit alcohol dehydrogenase family)